MLHHESELSGWYKVPIQNERACEYKKLNNKMRGQSKRLRQIAAIIATRILSKQETTKDDRDSFSERHKCNKALSGSYDPESTAHKVNTLSPSGSSLIHCKQTQPIYSHIFHTISALQINTVHSQHKKGKFKT